MDRDLNFDWLTELTDKLPEIPRQRENMFSIIGCSRKENAISNFLAFYFKKEEEHKFSTLLIDSLLDVVKEKGVNFKRNLYDGDYSVERETSTDSNKRIDVLLKNGEDWAIIIENKIGADLYNDLEDYWSFVNANNKIGIVLSVQPVAASKMHERYINILHQDLVNKIKQNLPSCYLEADDRHLLFLKEYILNIESMYDAKNRDAMEETLKLFHQYHNKIEKIDKLNNRDEIEKFRFYEKELSRYVAQSVSSVLGKYGFRSGGSDFAKSNCFNFDSENPGECKDYDFDILKRFRFWVSYEHLKKHNSFLSCFELYNKDNAKYGEQLNERLRAKQIYTSNVKEGKKHNQSIFQTYVLDIQLTSDDRCFEERLKEALDVHFFEKGFLLTAVSELKAIIEEERNTRS